MKKKISKQLIVTAFLLLAMGCMVSCGLRSDDSEVIIEAKIIEIDSENNTLIVSGINKSSMNQIGDKCIISYEEVKLFNEAGKDIKINDFKEEDIINIMCDGVIQESYPTSIANVEWIQINNKNK